MKMANNLLPVIENWLSKNKRGERGKVGDGKGETNTAMITAKNSFK